VYAFFLFGVYQMYAKPLPYPYTSGRVFRYSLFSRSCAEKAWTIPIFRCAPIGI